MKRLLPRLKPSDDDTPLFKKLYDMDCALDNDNDNGLLVSVVHGYTDALYADDAKAGANLLRILFVTAVNGRVSGDVPPPSFLENITIFQNILLELMPSVAAYYEALACFFDPENNVRGLDMLSILAVGGNELAHEFLENFLAFADEFEGE